MFVGRGEASVGEIVPCGPSREALLLSRKVTDGDADYRNVCLWRIRLQACGRCDAATSNLVIGNVESPKGRMACWMAASRMAFDEDWESELNRDDQEGDKGARPGLGGGGSKDRWN